MICGVFLFLCSSYSSLTTPRSTSPQYFCDCGIATIREGERESEGKRERERSYFSDILCEISLCSFVVVGFQRKRERSEKCLSLSSPIDDFRVLFCKIALLHCGWRVCEERRRTEYERIHTKKNITQYERGREIVRQSHNNIWKSPHLSLSLSSSYAHTHTTIPVAFVECILIVPQSSRREFDAREEENGNKKRAPERTPGFFQ